MASKLSLPFGKKDTAPKIPSKETMNLAIREVNEADRKSNIIVAVVAILAILLLGKFGFLDVYSAWQAENDKKNQYLHEQAETQLLLAKYSELADRYSHYYNAFLTDEEAALLDRIDLLDMLQKELFTQAKMLSVAVQGDQVTTQFSGVTLQQAGILQAHLLQNPMVTDAFYTIAQTDKQDAGAGENKEVIITMTLFVKQPSESDLEEAAKNHPSNEPESSPVSEPESTPGRETESEVSRP